MPAIFHPLLQVLFDPSRTHRQQENQMSNSSPIQARPTNRSEKGGGIRQSASFGAHIKRLERTIPLHARYGNFIGGEGVEPINGTYFDNISPTTGQVICQVPRSQ